MELKDLKYLSIRQASKILSVNYSTVYELVRSGRIKSIRFGKCVRISENDFMDFIKNCSN